MLSELAVQLKRAAASGSIDGMDRASLNIRNATARIRRRIGRGKTGP